MKAKQLLPALLVPAVIAVLLGGCFSPWQGGEGGEGTLTISLGGNPGGRIAVDETEQNRLSYTITLTGSGQTITETFPAGKTTATLKVQPGTWDVVVKGRGARPPEYSDDSSSMNGETPGFPAFMLRAMGESVVTVTAGAAANTNIDMYTATEVNSGAQLNGALLNARDDTIKEIVLVARDITTQGPQVQLNTNIHLWAEKHVTIKREVPDSPIVYVQGSLTLGKEGESNYYLDITGEGRLGTTPLIYVNVNGNLEIYDAMIGRNVADIANFAGPPCGVYVQGGTFTMYGGRIYGNKNTGANLGVNVGGGVRVDQVSPAGGKFVMRGGYIEGNQAQCGGQVYVGENCRFEMYEGTLSNKGGSTTGTQAEHGAGVYVLNDPVDISSLPPGVFIKTGGTIYGANGPTDLALRAPGNNGAAVGYGNGIATNHYRNSTLGPDDHLSTEDFDTNWND